MMKKPLIDTVVLQHPSAYHDFPIDLIQNQHPELRTAITHTVKLPILCPASQNPGEGSTLSIHYIANKTILELFALERYIKGFVQNQIVRDLELFAQVVAMECQKALNVEVIVEGNILLNGLNQTQQIKVVAPAQ